MSLGSVWVHWKPAADGSSAAFSLLVQGEFVVEVFDKWRQKPAPEPWEGYILRQLREFGTSVLDSYVKVLAELDSIEKQTTTWVLTKVESVKIVPDGILLEGCAEIFLPERAPELRSLR